MSMGLIVRVFHTPMDSPSDKLVLLALAEHAWDDGTHCWPSVDRVAAFAAMARSTVQRTLRRLETAGWIVVAEPATRYKPTSYAVAVERLQGPQIEAPRHKQGPRSASQGPRDGAAWAATENGRGRAALPEPVGEPKTGTRKENPNPSAGPAAAAGRSGAAMAWDGYREAYHLRYQTDPVRNAKVNGMLAAYAKRIAADELAGVAAFYLRHGAALYVRAGHPVDLLLRDCEKLRMEWITGRRITESGARESDRTQELGQVVDRVSRRFEQEAEARRG